MLYLKRRVLCGFIRITIFSMFRLYIEMLWFYALFGYVICIISCIMVYNFYRKFSLIFTYARGILGWSLYFFWMGLWFFPQPRIFLCVDKCVFVSLWIVKSSLINIFLGLIFIMMGSIFGLLGVLELSLSVSSHVEPDKVVVSGIYSKVRHPQYLGGFLAHIGFSLLLSGYYSLLATPLVFVLLYLMAIVEEKYLLARFGDIYREYMHRVPRFSPIPFR